MLSIIKVELIDSHVSGFNNLLLYLPQQSAQEVFTMGGDYELLVQCSSMVGYPEAQFDETARRSQRDSLSEKPGPVRLFQPKR